MRICKQFRFEAAHILPYHTGKCARMHGHSYLLEVTVLGPLHTEGPAQGMVMDFDEISSIVKPEVVERLDHRLLNEILENPTCELLASWIWNALIGRLPNLDEVALWETATARAVIRRIDLDDITNERDAMSSR